MFIADKTWTMDPAAHGRTNISQTREALCTSAGAVECLSSAKSLILRQPERNGRSSADSPWMGSDIIISLLSVNLAEQQSLINYIRHICTTIPVDNVYLIALSVFSCYGQTSKGLVLCSAAQDPSAETRRRRNISTAASPKIIPSCVRIRFENKNSESQPNTFPVQIFRFPVGPFLSSGVKLPDIQSHTGRLFAGRKTV